MLQAVNQTGFLFFWGCMNGGRQDLWQTGSERRYLRCRRGFHCWLRTRGHRLWTQNPPRRNSSPRTSASAAYTRPPQLGPGQEGRNDANVNAHTGKMRHSIGKSNESEPCVAACGSAWPGSTSFRLTTTGSCARHNLPSSPLINCR